MHHTDISPLWEEEDGNITKRPCSLLAGQGLFPEYNKRRRNGFFVLPERIMEDLMEKEGERIQTMNNSGRGSGLTLISRMWAA